MAPAGKPLCLTGLGNESRRLIGRPVGHAEVKIWDAVVDRAPLASSRVESSPEGCLTVTRGRSPAIDTDRRQRKNHEPGTY